MELLFLFIWMSRDPPVGPMAKTWLSNMVGSFDPWLGSYDSTCLEAKKPKQNRSRIVTSLIKT